ncbi:hypothetical protein D3C86_2201840 [compost metagenome]
MNLHLAEGEAADQGIPHAHLHLIPRRQGDAVKIHLPCQRSPKREELDSISSRLRQGHQILRNS